MRTKLLTLAALLVTPLCFGEMHEFTSADGSKAILAEVLKVDAKKNSVTLLIKGGRQTNAAITAFSEEDQQYIQKISKVQEIGRTLAVRFEDTEEIVSEKKNPNSGYQTLSKKNGYKLEIRNNAAEDVAGLKAEYQIFYKAYQNPFSSRERTELVTAGTMDIPELGSRDEKEVTTAPINMTQIKQLPKSECVGGT